MAIRILRGKQLLNLIVTLGTAPQSTTQDFQDSPIGRKKLAEQIEAALTGSPDPETTSATPSRPPSDRAVSLQRVNPQYGDFDIAVPAGWQFQQGQDENPIIVGRRGPAGPSLMIWAFIRVTAVAENMSAGYLIGQANWSLNACGPLAQAVFEAIFQ